MTMTGNGARLDDRHWGSYLDQDDHGRHDGNRRGRIQNDAQRAMVRIAFERMGVRHLGNGQQREQGQAQQSGRPESARLAASVLTKMCPKSGQQTNPCFKNTQNWTRTRSGGLRNELGFRARSAANHSRTGSSKLLSYV
jgi:hypothetical protein